MRRALETWLVVGLLVGACSKTNNIDAAPPPTAAPEACESAGTYRCAGDVLQECVRGLWISQTACLKGACVDGSASCPVDPAKACPKGGRRCDGATPQTCSDDETAWISGAPCADGTACQPSTGQCVPTATTDAGDGLCRMDQDHLDQCKLAP